MTTAIFDIVIRNGTIVDGSGSPAYLGDVAISGGRIVAVGSVEGRGREEINATDRLVTPGFVDVHTHYDGQVTWENTLAPSSGHGVTTVVTGNCGVGFAPVRDGDQQMLVKVMEGVEDIPEIVMAEGIPWNWESFADYLDALDARSFDIDVATQLPHSPLRVYVMGKRGAEHAASTPEDRAVMARMVTEAVQAGALGVTTSRSTGHRLKNGEFAPSVTTSNEELYALADGLCAAGNGVFQIIPEAGADPADEFAVIRTLAERSGRPVSFTLLQAPRAPDAWQTLLSGVERANADGLTVRGQVFPRPVGVLLGLDLSLHPFMTRPSYQAIAHLPLAERAARMRDPEMKARIIGEEPIPDPQPMNNVLIGKVGEMFVLTDPVDYAPPIEQTLERRAEAAGLPLDSFVYDLLVENGGNNILYLPGANFVGNSLGAARQMMAHPHTILGLGDGGAHYGFICDASFTTFVMTYWVRDAADDQRFPLEWAVAELTRRPAEAVGLTDRGLVQPGMKADLNVIDHARLTLHAPHTVHDLPTGGRRLRQEADGYDATIVNGVVTYRNGEPTGELPGRLVRGGGYRPLAQAA
jgi:N-acyl-D-amino-acid deacylase